MINSNKNTSLSIKTIPATDTKNQLQNNTGNNKNALLFIIIFSVLVIIDFSLINISFHDKNLYKYINNYNIFNSSTIFSQSFLTVTVTILTIFFAVYFIIIQLFRSRYPLNFIEKYVKQYMLSISSSFISNISFGIILLIFNTDMILSKLFYAFHVFHCIISFVKTYKNYKILNPSEIINSYKSRIISNISCENINKKDFEECLNELGTYSEESFSKNEVILSKYILEIYSDLIIYVLENKNRITLNQTEGCKEDISKIEKKLFLSIVLNLKLGINYNNINYLEDVFDKIEDIFESCIICDCLDTFTALSRQLDKFFSYTTTKNNIIAANNIINLYGSIADYILSKGLREEWVNVLKDKFAYYSIAVNIHINQSTLKTVLSEYFLFMEKCFEYNKFNIYDDLFESVIRLIYNSLSKVNNNIFNFVKILFILHTKKIIALNKNDLLIKYIDKLNDIGLFGFDSNNKDLCIHISGIFDYILENCIDKVVSDKISKLKCKFTIKSIYFDEDLVPLFIPDYLMKMTTYYENSDFTLIESNLSEFEEILSRTLFRKSTNIILYLLDILNDMIFLFDKDKKQQQELFFDLYKRCFNTCVDIKSSEVFHIVLEQLSILIKKLDKEEKISEQLGKNIITTYEKYMSRCILVKQEDFCISVIEKLSDMPKELDFVFRKREIYIELVNSLFQAGLNAIENNADSVIRNISNHYGWMAMFAIENNNSEIFGIIIDNTSSMLNLCIDMKINEGTIVFIGTLFIVIGGHTSVEKSGLQIYMNRVITNIRKLNRTDFLKQSKMLRLFESNTWNEYMDNKAKYYIDKFYRSLNLND